MDLLFHFQAFFFLGEQKQILLVNNERCQNLLLKAVSDVSGVLFKDKMEMHRLLF